MSQCKKQVGWPPPRFKQLTSDISAVSCVVLKTSRMLFVFVVFFTVGTTAGRSCRTLEKTQNDTKYPLNVKTAVYIGCIKTTAAMFMSNRTKDQYKAWFKKWGIDCGRKNRPTWKICKCKLMWADFRGQKNTTPGFHIKNKNKILFGTKSCDFLEKTSRLDPHPGRRGHLLLLKSNNPTE